MCKIQDVRVYNQYSSRTARVSDSVEVNQSSSFAKQREWSPATVHFSCTSGRTPEQAREFAACLLLACEIAEEWTKERAGKPFEPPKEEGEDDQAV